MEKQRKRSEILKLHFEGKNNMQISNMLNIPRTTVRRDIDHFKERGDFNDHKHVRKPTVAVPALVEKLRKRFKRNSALSMRKVARSVSINREIVRQIAKNKLKLYPYKLRERQELTEKKEKSKIRKMQKIIEVRRDKKLAQYFIFR